MNFKELKYGGRSFINDREIIKVLKDNKFYWLVDSEVDDAKIEIINDTLIWHSGSYLSGDWYYGIFKNGEFYGVWQNGIFEDGEFYGKWESGINLKK